MTYINNFYVNFNSIDKMRLRNDQYIFNPCIAVWNQIKHGITLSVQQATLFYLNQGI